MFVIETQHKKIPWRWIILIQLVSASRLLVFFASASMIFTMKKYIDSPMVINSITSLDIVFNFLVTAPCLYYSDRIWTRFGRRMPFITVSFVILGIVLLLLPLAASAVPMGIIVVLWFIFWDVGSTFDVLIMEITPPEQRGRAAAIGTWMFNAIIMLSAVVITGRFDDVVHRTGFTLTGEELIYWWGVACVIFSALFLGLFVREQKPLTPPPTDHGGGIKGTLASLFAEKTLWPVYFLAFSVVLMQTGLGAIDPLLMTEQWGYSKQDMGTNIFVGGLINLVIIIPLIGILTDKMKSLKVFGIGVVGTLLSQIVYYVYIQFVLPDQRPSIAQIIIFGQLLSIASQFCNIALQPLIFEFIPRNKMGTSQAGLNFVRSFTRMLTLNGIGIWVATYSKWFLPAGKYDYFSGYLFMILMNLIGCCFLVYFARQVRRGVILPQGLIDPDSAN
ncbi:MAG: MFS transporter [Luteolibacter sp.]